MIELVVLGSGKTLLNILEKLKINKNFNIKGIGSNTLIDLDIINFAKNQNITIIDNLNQLENITFDFIYMFNYAPLIKKKYLDKYLFVNTHYAPLPKYRGFHGLIWCIINGEKEIGYTIHKAIDGIDNGPIYYQHIKDIEEKDNINTLIKYFDEHLIQNIEKQLLNIYHGLEPLIQNEKNAIYVTRRKQEDNLINWNMPSRYIYNFVRALTPPYTDGAYTFINNKKIYILETEFLNIQNYIERVGKIVNISSNGMLVKTVDNAILIKKVRIDGLVTKDMSFTKVGNILKEII